MSKQMKDLQKYQICETALNNAIAIMRDVFGDDFLKWKDKTARKIYEDLLNVYWDIITKTKDLRKEK